VHQISVLWFLKDHVTEDWSNDAETSALSSQKKNDMLNDKIQSSSFKLYSTISQYCCFHRFFLSNKCSLSEYKRLLSHSKIKYKTSFQNVVFVNGIHFQGDFSFY